MTEIVDPLLDTAFYVKTIGEAALADTPLSLLSSRMLAEVVAEPGITVSEISRRIPKTQQALSNVGAQLTGLGLLERRLGSGRGVGLHPTDAGRSVAEQARTREVELHARLRALLGEERYAALTQVSAESAAILRDAR